MKSHLIAVAILLSLFSCMEKNKTQFDQTSQFTADLEALKDYFQIPGLAASIEKNGQIIYQNNFGLSDIATQTKLDSTILFPIASLTKVFSGVLMMKLLEEGKISLDDPIKQYLPEMVPMDSILIKHVLSHTSQGKVGTQFYYSSRFGLLTKVIEQAAGASFADVMQTEIFQPLGLENTLLLKDSQQIVQHHLNIATPYFLDDGIEKGALDFGYSTSAGIVSNIEDLQVFNRALDNNTLISEKSKDLMFSAFGGKLPYAYGIFNQQFDGLNIVWAYGQYDCHSSLLLKIPAHDITLILLANNNLMSDPARLIYGNATYSLFALSFLKNYIYELDDRPLLETEADMNNLVNISNPKFYRQKLLAQALSASFMARFELEKRDESIRLLEKIFSEFPDYLSYADLSLLHNLSFLKDIAFYMELGEFNNFDPQIEAISQKLLEEDTDNPYVHIYMGVFHGRKGNTEKARYHFEQIINAANFSRNWYTFEAENWLKEINEQ